MFPFFYERPAGRIHLGASGRMTRDNGIGLLKYRIVFWIIVIGIVTSSDLKGQVPQEREIRMAIPEDSLIQLDPWILPESFQVWADNTALPPEDWTLNTVTGEWSWDVATGQRTRYDTLLFQYNVWPIDLPVTVFERERVEADILTDDPAQGPEEIRRRPIRQQDLFGDTELQRSGSVRRGIVLGTARDFSMESGLHFDISGKITDDIDVVASLTDRSTPIQPDGTTQTLREFDQVYIRMQHEMGQMQMGDIDMRLDQSNFAVIDRRLQGVNIQTELNQYGTYQGSAAVVRGKYREMQFSGEDGVQGPYRLTGEDNEQFIIVMAGSERVYIDGQRMVRGEENDYVIDYGLGEITFTSNRIITDHTRITVDFQYLRDGYTRTVLAAEAANDELAGGRVSFGASAIRESDNVNLSTQLFLTESEREILRDAGDDPQQAVVSGADSVGFRRDADFLLYSRVDTIYQGETYEIFEHIPGDSSGVFRVQFSRMPEGEGDYRRVGRAANGILYEWVGPGLGNYMPKRRLSRPVEQHMVALRSRVRATSHISLFGEWAGSYYDQNRLSALDNENNDDMSLLAGLRMEPYPTRLGTFDIEVAGRYEGENFAYFDRVREVEFDRRWNLSERSDSRETRFESTGGWAPSQNTDIAIGAGLIERDRFKGARGDLQISSREEGLPSVDYYLEYIDSEDRNFNEKGSWWRQRGRVDYEISLPAGSLQPELEFEQEERLQESMAGDSLLPQSLRFFEIGPGLFFQMTDNFRIGSSVRYREDAGVLNGELADESYGITQRYMLDYRHGTLFQTENVLGFRQRRFEEMFRREQQRLDSRGVLVRSVSDYRPWNRFVETQLLYDANTERRPLMQEAFIEVGPEMGQYVWVDINDDGVQQIDEFFPEQSPNEGTFIKQLVPSEELFPVISLRTRWRTTIDPSHLIDPHDARFSDWLNFLSGLRWHSTIDIREENRTEQLEDIYLLRLDRFRDDSLTIHGRLFIEQELEMFRNNPRREFRLTGDRMLSQNQQASGLERRKTENVTLTAGGRLSRRFRIATRATVGRNENTSETFTSRNFTITGGQMRPRLDIRWNSAVQSGLGFSVIRKQDRYPHDPASLRGLTSFIDSRLSFGTRWQATMRVEQRRFDLDGGPATSLGEFEMTEGAGLGRTWAWSLQTNYRISDFLRASVQYDGRTLTHRPAVQTMRFTVNAVF